jgi:hypothetical protein
VSRKADELTQYKHSGIALLLEHGADKLAVKLTADTGDSQTGGDN